MESDDKQKTERSKRNNDLISRMKNGEDIRLITPEQTFFPPRPPVKKDKEVVKRLFSLIPKK